MLSRRISFVLSLFSRLFDGYKFHILILAVLGLVSGLLESIGISMLIPIFSIIVGETVPGAGTLPQIVVTIFAYFENLRPDFIIPLSRWVSAWLGRPVNSNLIWLLSLVPIFFIIKTVLVSVFSYINLRVVSSFELDTRSRLYQKTLFANWPYLLRQKIGYLENTLMLDVRMTAKLMNQFTSIILDASSFLMYAAVAITISLNITLVTLAVGLAIFIVNQLFMKKTREYTKQQTVLNKVIAHHINEHISGIKMLKASHVEQAVAERGEGFFNEVKNVTLRQALIKNILNAFVSPLSIFFIVIVFAVSYAQPGFNLAVFAATIYLIQRIFIHVHTTQKSIHTINDFVPYLVNVASMENKIEKHLEVEVGEKPFTFNDTLEFKNIKFAYNENNPVLREVNLTIQKGKMIGIIGPSGSGKTTFVDLLLRLFDPQSGSIILDGVDANEIKLGEWRRRIEYVPQDIFLLNDTVSNNIRFYDGNITDSDVMRAAKMANIHDFIDGLKNKFDTVIGERGVLLSGGQKQRVVLARALARRPDILVLDEATSALDNESENIIKETLEKLRGEITFIVIAHRLSTVMNADKIVVLDGGKIIEEGNPSDLMQKDNSYLYRTYHTSYN